MLNTRFYKLHPKNIFIISAIFLISFMYAANACVLPVFRYAVERWESDQFEIIIFHDSVFTKDDSIALSKIGKRSQYVSTDHDILKKTGNFKPGNITTYLTHVKDTSTRWINRIRKRELEDSSVTLPHALILFPSTTGISNPIWRGPVGKMPIDNLVDSPIRREIGKRIVSGETGVWVILESSDKGKNRSVHKKLSKYLDKAMSELKIQEIDPAELPSWYDPESSPELQVKFSMLSVSRTDPSEAMFVNMLLQTDPNIKNNDDPIVFCIFGRGRALVNFSEDLLSENNVLDVCRFLLGPCSCVVKEENPGVDIIMAVNWNERIVTSLVKDEPLPPLTGFSNILNKREKDKIKDEMPSSLKKGDKPIEQRHEEIPKPKKPQMNDDFSTEDAKLSGSSNSSPLNKIDLSQQEEHVTTAQEVNPTKSSTSPILIINSNKERHVSEELASSEESKKNIWLNLALVAVGLFVLIIIISIPLILRSKK